MQVNTLAVKRAGGGRQGECYCLGYLGNETSFIDKRVKEPIMLCFTEDKLISAVHGLVAPVCVSNFSSV